MQHCDFKHSKASIISICNHDCLFIIVFHAAVNTFFALENMTRIEKISITIKDKKKSARYLSNADPL